MPYAVVDAPSPNHGPRPPDAEIGLLVVHYTETATTADAIHRLCDPLAEVSSHYLVDEQGGIFRLVSEDRRAWHAGVSSWRGRGDVNSWSIGIELVNPGHGLGYRPFPPAQMDAFAALARAIMERHHLGRFDIVGHSDIAPARKRDPGELFDWEALASRGIGLYPPAIGDDPSRALSEGSEGAEVTAFQGILAAIGYDCPVTGRFDSETRTVVEAFQRRFRPWRVDGTVDRGCMLRGAWLFAEHQKDQAAGRATGRD